jgi:hypothetical protein
VTAAGQTVGGVADKSGNANHLSQASAASRPVLAESEGRRYLVFDGVDDHFTASSMGNPAVFTAIHGVHRPSSAARSFALATTGGNGPLSPTLFSTSGTFLGGGDTNYARHSASAPTAKCVVSGFWNSNWSASSIRINGAALTPLNASAASPVSVLNVYGRRGSQYAAQDDYGHVFVQRALSQSELDAAERWMAGRAGVTW